MLSLHSQSPKHKPRKPHHETILCEVKSGLEQRVVPTEGTDHTVVKADHLHRCKLRAGLQLTPRGKTATDLAGNTIRKDQLKAKIGLDHSISSLSRVNDQ